MKRAFMVLAFVSVFLLPLKAQDYNNNTAFDTDFKNAVKMAPSSTEAAGGTDLLIKDTTSVLHREQLAILDELAKLRKEIADLKKDVKAIKGQVEY